VAIAAAVLRNLVMIVPFVLKSVQAFCAI
jgi:hypothetical protein